MVERDVSGVAARSHARKHKRLLAEVKGARLLQGFRGRPAADLEALADTLVRVSHLAMHLEGHLAELDINPLMVLPSGQGVKAVDALVVFRGT
jgi:acetyltransferase